MKIVEIKYVRNNGLQCECNTFKKTTCSKPAIFEIDGKLYCCQHSRRILKKCKGLIFNG